MINFSKISQKSLGGKILRGMLKLVPKNSVLPILQGGLKGKKWVKGSGANGYWLGTYEWKKQKIFGEKVKEGDIVYDVGAHAGFYTLLAAELVGKNGKVFSFEPDPRNVFYLKKNVSLNKYNNIEVLETAVSGKTGIYSFNAEKDSFYSKFSKDGVLKVKTIALDDLRSKEGILPPNVVKIDVEGAELSVLEGTAKILKEFKPLIFLSTHSQEIYNLCLNFLKPLGYNLEIIEQTDNKADTEILAYSK